MHLPASSMELTQLRAPLSHDYGNVYVIFYKLKLHDH